LNWQPTMLPQYTPDLLILGVGAAGLSAAIAAHDAGARVLLLSKSTWKQTASHWAQGGIAAALNAMEDGDSFALHVQDTLASGKGLSNPDAVEILCREGIDRIQQLERWGTPFDRQPDGKIAQRPYGGHSRLRVCHSGDRIGQGIVQTLWRQVGQRDIPLLTGTALKLNIKSNRCHGVVVWLENMSHSVLLEASTTLLATGGLGKLFAVSTPPEGTTGDGYALALDAGIVLQDMAMLQFHPTGFFPSGKLVSEACRAEGGYLVNRDGKRFMFDYDQRGELATRDVVARGIAAEIEAGRGWDGTASVGLDVRHLGKEKIVAKLPEALHNAKTVANIDLLTEILPVAPTQHYCMGGIPTDLDGRVMRSPDTDEIIQSLFAAGEVACLSVHGANRLGCNSLLECLVYGHRAGSAAAQEVERKVYQEKSFQPRKVEFEDVFPWLETTPKSTKDGLTTATLLAELQQAMTTHAGVIRTRGGTAQLSQQLTALAEQFKQIPITSDSRKNLLTHHQFQTQHTLAHEITRQIQATPHSLGAHFWGEEDKGKEALKKSFPRGKLGLFT